MEHILSSDVWAKNLFSKCDLGDKRRTNRLIKTTSLLARKIGSSLASACEGDLAAVEGSYRLIRNPSIKSAAIAEGGFQATAQRAKSYELLLALEDSTSFNYLHETQGLEKLKGNNGNVRGFYAHSVLLVDPLAERTIGLIEQHRWQRKIKERGKRYQLRKREYKDKESYKWESASRNMSKRLGDKMSDIISVCDREADIYEYLDYKRATSQRFVVRAVRDRLLEMEDELISEVMSQAPILGHYTIEIAQKSGRKARKARVAVRSMKVTLKGIRRPKFIFEDMEVNVIVATEVDCNPKGNSDRLSWVLLTNEPAETFGQARSLIRYYEMRWRIEEFHKAWKTGAGAEKQRMQSADNLEKMIVILGFIAIRLLQLKEALEVKDSLKADKSDRVCTEVLTQDEFIVLWLANKCNRNKKIPKKPPSLKWAYESIAKLGGWSNSKLTGKASWLTIWEGWYRLQERLEGYKVAKYVV